MNCLRINCFSYLALLYPSSAQLSCYCFSFVNAAVQNKAHTALGGHVMFPINSVHGSAVSRSSAVATLFREPGTCVEFLKYVGNCCLIDIRSLHV